jgi:hypothetical protein
MKNVLLSSPATDAKVFHAMMVIESLAVVVLVGYISPTPLDNAVGRALNSGISLGLAIFAWVCFRLLEPKRNGGGWSLVRLAAIPCLWLLVFFAVVVWIQHNQAVFMDLLDKVHSLFNRALI